MRVTAKDKAKLKALKAEAVPGVYPLYRKWRRDSNRRLREAKSFWAALTTGLTQTWIGNPRLFAVWRHGYEYPSEPIEHVMKYQTELEFWNLGRKTKYREIARNG